MDCKSSVLTAQIPYRIFWLIQRKCQSACWRPYYWGLKGWVTVSPLPLHLASFYSLLCPRHTGTVFASHTLSLSPLLLGCFALKCPLKWSLSTYSLGSALHFLQTWFKKASSPWCLSNCSHWKHKILTTCFMLFSSERKPLSSLNKLGLVYLA